MQSSQRASTPQTRLEDFAIARSSPNVLPKSPTVDQTRPRHNPASDPLRVYVLCGVV